jgi:3-deoxy-D-manno-octulosonic-acid transferase
VDKQPVDMVHLNHLKNKIAKRKFWLVNCTHSGEEEIIVQTHKILKEKYPDILTIDILRHPERGSEVADLVVKKGLVASLISKNGDISDDTDFYIYDKVGELGTFFELSEIVFIAGSLKPKIGGHSPVECIKHSCCLITGTFIESNKMLFNELLNKKACIMLKDNRAETLAKTVSELFENEELRSNIIGESYAESIRSVSCLNEIINKIYDII